MIISRRFNSKVVAEILEYDYPLEAEKCAERYIQIKSDRVLLKMELSCILVPILCMLVVCI